MGFFVGEVLNYFVMNRLVCLCSNRLNALNYFILAAIKRSNKNSFWVLSHSSSFEAYTTLIHTKSVFPCFGSVTVKVAA